jgi:hypothetical protein
MRTFLPHHTTALLEMYINFKAMIDLGPDTIMVMTSETLRDTIIMIGHMILMRRALNHIETLIRTALVMKDSLFDKNHLLTSISTRAEMQIIDDVPGLPSAHTAKPMATILVIATLCATVAIKAHSEPSVADEVDIPVAKQRIVLS